MNIMKVALMERLRKKQLYIIGGVSFLMIFLLRAGQGNLTINGKAVSGFDSMTLVYLSIIHFMSCLLALVLSTNTINKEYERRTSHLIWIRGVLQDNYHGQLALANIVSVLIVELFMFLEVLIYFISQDKGNLIPQLLLAYVVMSLSPIFISTLLTAFSVKLSPFIVGIIGFFVMIFGAFHGVISMISGTIFNHNGGILKMLLEVMPDLNKNVQTATNLIQKQTIDTNIVWTMLFAIYISSMGIIFLKRREV